MKGLPMRRVCSEGWKSMLVGGDLRSNIPPTILGRSLVRLSDDLEPPRLGLEISYRIYKNTIIKKYKTSYKLTSKIYS